jgi:hypothetical protein
MKFPRMRLWLASTHLMIIIFWEMTPCGSYKNTHFFPIRLVESPKNWQLIDHYSKFSNEIEIRETSTLSTVTALFLQFSLLLSLSLKEFRL